MTSRLISKIVVGTVMGLALAVPAAAQNSAGPNVSVGYSIFNLENSTSGAGFLAGVEYPVSTSGNLGISAVGEIGIHRFGDFDTTITSFMGGGRISGLSNEVFRPFGQVLVGGIHSPGITDFSLSFGGGVDVTLNAPVNVRAEIDFPIDYFEGTHETGKRFTFSVVLPFGR